MLQEDVRVPKLDLIPRDPVYDLPILRDGLELTLVQPDAIVTLAPFAGQVMAVADVLRAHVKLGLPKQREVRTRGHTRILWIGPGLWLLAGVFDPVEIAKALSGVAAVCDQSDGFVALHLTGEKANNLLARLTPLDVDRLDVDQTACCEIVRMSGILTRSKSSFDILLPRSPAIWAVERISAAADRMLP